MSTAIIALIGIAWAMSLPNRFASGIEGVGAEADTISPFDVFSDSIKEAFPSVVAGVDLEEFNDTAGENLDATSSAWY